MSASEIKPEGENQISPQQRFSDGLGKLITDAAAAGITPDYVMTELEIQKLFTFEAFKSLMQKKMQAMKSPIIKPIR